MPAEGARVPIWIVYSPVHISLTFQSFGMRRGDAGLSFPKRVKGCNVMILIKFKTYQINFLNKKNLIFDFENIFLKVGKNRKPLVNIS